MGDVGELLVALAVMGIAAYYRLPWLRRWVRGAHSVNSAPVPVAAPEAGNPHSDAAEPIGNPPRSAPAEPRSDEGTYTIEDVIAALGAITVRWPDGREEPISTDKLAALYGGRRETALQRVRQLAGREPPPPPPGPDTHILADGERWVPRATA